MIPIFINTSSTVTPTLPLHDALPISDARHAAAIHAHEHDLVRSVTRGRESQRRAVGLPGRAIVARRIGREACESGPVRVHRDRKSTRLNSSHRCISYAVFCLKKKI